jgi:Domain of unknown function (DUF4372)
MNQERTVFSQLVEFLPSYPFQICVDRYQGNRYVKDFSCWDQFLCLAFAQLTYRESLRDIEACLRDQQPKLYHMGFRGQVSRNTLAHANEHRDWRIYADFAQVLIAAARDLYRDESFGVELSETVYALDSTLARSRLCGLRSPVCLGPILCLLRHSRQKEYAVLPSQLTSRRTIAGLRSD